MSAGDVRAALERRGSIVRRRARERWYLLLDRTSPRVFCAWNRRFSERQVVDSTTDLVIEGYPSAANSLARETFAFSHGDLKIASHLHAAAHVRRAIDLNIPTLVLIREPVGSIASIIARFPDERFDISRELCRYARFYSAMSNLIDGIVVFSFENTTTNLGLACRLLNDRFGSSFAIDDEDHHLREQVRLVLDNWSQYVFGQRAAEATPRPSDKRRASLEQVRAEILRPAHRTDLAKCHRLYAHLSTIATASATPSQNAEPASIDLRSPVVERSANTFGW